MFKLFSNCKYTVGRVRFSKLVECVILNKSLVEVLRVCNVFAIIVTFEICSDIFNKLMVNY